LKVFGFAADRCIL